MAYGHAERNLALLRQLEAETRQLLESQEQPDSEQSAWPQEVTTSGDNPRLGDRTGQKARQGCPDSKEAWARSGAWPPRAQTGKARYLSALQ